MSSGRKKRQDSGENGMALAKKRKSTGWRIKSDDDVADGGFSQRIYIIHISFLFIFLHMQHRIRQMKYACILMRSIISF